MGGCVALDVSLRHPGRTAALMAIDTTAPQDREKALDGGMAAQEAVVPPQRHRGPCRRLRHAGRHGPARDIAARIPGATLAILPGARHLTPLERPAEVAAALLALAARG